VVSLLLKELVSWLVCIKENERCVGAEVGWCLSREEVTAVEGDDTESSCAAACSCTGIAGAKELT
jgi:hypothetical protein